MCILKYTDMRKSIFTTQVFDRWFLRLKDRVGKAHVQERIDRLEDGHYGDFKALGDGLFELRVHCGPGYRVYFMERGEEIVILLVGGNKGSQARDLTKANSIAQEYR